MCHDLPHSFLSQLNSVGSDSWISFVTLQMAAAREQLCVPCLDKQTAEPGIKPPTVGSLLGMPASTS